MASGMSEQELTLDIMRQAAESIHDFLKFTGKVAREGKSIPVLDTQMWVGWTVDMTSACSSSKDGTQHV